jgi:hypothetical protein
MNEWISIIDAPIPADWSKVEQIYCPGSGPLAVPVLMTDSAKDTFFFYLQQATHWKRRKRVRKTKVKPKNDP